MRMMYPGVVLHNLLKPALAQGRAKLIETEGASRALIHSHDGKNAIDTVFIDKRNTKSAHGQTLIICCDGNAAFYEIGIFGRKQLIADLIRKFLLFCIFLKCVQKKAIQR